MPGKHFYVINFCRLFLAAVFLFTFTFCASKKYRVSLKDQQDSAFSGTVFYKQAAAYGWQQRDSLTLVWVFAGHIPSFIKKLVRINVSITDSMSGKTIDAYYFVSPDYLCVGNDKDWARVPITPMAAEQIADSLDCFLPTRKMVDDIYMQAKVKLEPIPMFAYRDSTPTMWQHHLIIEGQRQRRTGLIAGIKKDVVATARLRETGKSNKVAIYGWHKSDGKPIQPLYTGHVNWYVDYSHGIRLVSEMIFVNKKPMHYSEVLKHPVYHKLICDEDACDYLQ
jgi:hypothetical protein